MAASSSISVLQQVLDLVGNASKDRVQMQPEDFENAEDHRPDEAFAEEERRRQAESRAEDQCQNGGVKRSPDFTGDTMLARVRVPDSAVEEVRPSWRTAGSAESAMRSTMNVTSRIVPQANRKLRPAEEPVRRSAARTTAPA